MDIVDELKDRARSYDQSGPSAQHTAELLRRAAIEIESLRRQWSEGVTKLLGQVKENKSIIDDATARLDRAGL